MKTVQVNVPDDLGLKDFDYAMMIASKLYERGVLAAGHAAKIAGVSKPTFLEMLGQYDVSVFNISPAELEQELS